MFHDLGEFDTKSTFESSDSPKEDNTMKTIDILFKEGIIRKILDDTKYDNVIKIAIYCHNKEGLPKNIDDKVIHICNILKDTYKIEELRMVIDYPYIDNRIDTYPSNTVYEEFKKMDLIDDKIVNNNADNILVVLSNVFCLNYRYSYYLLKENDYLSKITNSLIFADKKIEKFYKQLETILSNYINKKIMEK